MLRRPFLLLVPVLGALVLHGPASAGAMTAGNLVVAGDGETAPVPAWVSTAGSLVRSAYGTEHYPASPPLVGGGVLDGGTSLLHGTGAATTATQDVALSPDDVDALGTGAVRAELSADLGGWLAQQDRMGVDVVWRDAAGATVLEQHLAPLAPADRGNATGFVHRTAEDVVPAAARSAQVVLRGQRFEGSFQDGWLDNLELRLIGIPRVAPSFGVPTAAAGDVVPVTLAVLNSEDQRAKGPWSLALRLPDGLRVAVPIPARTSCADGALRVSGAVLEASGTTRAGEASCAFTLGVVAERAGTYELGPAAIVSADGLRPPAGPAPLTVAPAAAAGPGSPAELPPPVAGAPAAPAAAPVATPTTPATPPAVRPAARRPVLRLAASAGTARRGRPVRLRAVVRNAGAAAATDVDVCVVLPRGVGVLTRPGSGRRAPGGRCWTVRRLGPGAHRTVALTVRPGRAMRVLALRWRTDPAEGGASATARQTVEVSR